MAERKKQKEKSSLLSLPPMMVSVIVRDVEGGTACATAAGAEGPAPALSAGSGARKTLWPSIGAVFCFSLSLLTRRSVLQLLLLQRELSLCSLWRKREGDEERSGAARKEREVK